ncbi:glycosyltransferase [Acidobacteria bacterium AB60]|nr:glycosyltransferase [Acidobacteria bacterium AB60]
MRFLHVIPSVDRRTGGPVEALRQIGTLHQELGHTIEAVSLDPPGSPAVGDMPLPTHALGPGLLAYGFSPRLTRWLKANGRRFDAAIVHGLWQYPTHAARVALSGHVPYFVYTHGMLDPWFNQRFPFKHFKKSLYWRLHMRRDLDEAAGVIFTCEKEMERSISAFFPFQWRGLVAPLGIAEPPGDHAAQLAEIHTRFPQLRGRRFLLFFGRVHPKKGCELLVHAFAQVAREAPNLQLVIAGPSDAPYLNLLQKKLTQAGLDNRTLFTGMVTGSLKWGLLRGADAFVLPSHQENFAIATIEAMAVDTPVLISDKVQIWPDVLRCGAGLVEPDTFDGTERLLRRWLTLPEAERVNRKHAAGACYHERFTARQAGITLLHELTARLRSLRGNLETSENQPTPPHAGTNH